MSDHRAGSEDDIKALVEHVVSLGATQDDIERAARVRGLGPLALDLAMRPAGRSVPFETFLDETHMDADQVRRLWSALGLPESPPMPFPVTPDIAERARGALVPDDAPRRGSRPRARASHRVVRRPHRGRAVERDAVGVEVPQITTGMPYSEVARNYSTVAASCCRCCGTRSAPIFRRHLVLVSYQRWSTDEERVAVTVERTVGFVDLVGSTEVLRTLTVSELAAAVEPVRAVSVWDLVTAAGGRVVKLIGDEAMFVVDEPAAACRLASAMVERSPHPVRVGLAFGPAVALHGDYYGPTVNLAARLGRVAPPSSVVVSSRSGSGRGGGRGRVRLRAVPRRAAPRVSRTSPTAFRREPPDSLPSSR